jgi:glycerol-3-phosphate acyltransferase PlsX
MGGDNAPEINIEGAMLAVESFPLKVTLTGVESELNKLIAKYPNFPHDKIKIHHASETVGMAESPTMSFRKKKDSSIQVGLRLVKEGKADAFVSAGNTGAVMTTALFVLGRLKGVERPVLAAVFPSSTKHFVLMDVGSSVDCKPQHLMQFAIMGHHFSNSILGVENPGVGLYNIGEEPDKGNQLTQATYKLLKESDLNFIGNVEGKDLTKGKADVVVCDGFVGNSLLKFGEGVSKMFTKFFKEEAKSSLLSLIGLLFLKPAFKRFKKKYDYDQYGGAHLLGVGGICIVAHGSAGPVAIRNAIKTAYRGLDAQMVSTIGDAIASTEIQKEES